MGDEREFPPATVRAYQRVMERGLSEFVAGRWAEARALFQRGHVLLPNARSSRALGMTAFNLRLYPAAFRELNEALGDPRRPVRGALREQTEALLAQADTLVGRYRVLLEPPAAELRVDGLVTKLERDGTLLMGLGQHLLEVEAPKYLPLARTLSVDGRDDGVLVLRLRPRLTEEGGKKKPPPPPPPPPRWLSDYPATWSLAGGTLVLASATLGVQLAAAGVQRRLEARCQGGICTHQEPDFAKRDRLDAWGQGLLMSSLVFAVTTAVVAFVEHKRAREQRDLKARLELLQDPL